MQGLMTICHDARKGGYIGSHWPKHLAPLLYSTQLRTEAPRSRGRKPAVNRQLTLAGTRLGSL